MKRGRVILLAALALFMATGAASPSCSVPGSSSATANDPCHPADTKRVPDGDSISALQKCWPTTYSPPSTNQAIIAHGAHNRPGTVHVVIVAIDVFNAQAVRVNQPCFVVAVAVAGVAPAINTETGMPYLDEQGITTPDVIRYELGAGVTSLNISIASLAGAGLNLRAEAQLDGRPYGRPSFVSNPLNMAGNTRMLSTHVTVEIPA